MTSNRSILPALHAPAEGSGVTVIHPADCRTILDKALNTPGPVLVEVIVDPKEAPVSPRPPSHQAEQVPV